MEKLYLLTRLKVLKNHLESFHLFELKEDLIEINLVRCCVGIIGYQLLQCNHFLRSSRLPRQTLVTDYRRSCA